MAGFTREVGISGASLVAENCETARLFLDKIKGGDGVMALKLRIKLDEELGVAVKQRAGAQVGTAGERGRKETAIVVAAGKPEAKSALEEAVGDSEKANWLLCFSDDCWLCKFSPLTVEKATAIHSILFQL